MCVYLFCLHVDILCGFNVQICMPEIVFQIQVSIQNTIVSILTIWETHHVDNDFTTQLSIGITCLHHILHLLYRNISKMADQSLPVNP